MRIATMFLLALALPAPAFADDPGDSDRRDLDGNPYLPGVQPVVLHGSATQGGSLVFDDPALFLAAAGPVSTETFEDETHVGECDGGAVPFLAVSDFVATSNPVALKILRDECFGNHNTTPGGVKYLSGDTDVGDVSAQLMLVLPQPVTALGLWIVDLDTAGLEVVIQGAPYAVAPNGNGGESYFGIISATPFTEAMFRIVDGTDAHYSVDDVSLATSGPVPVEDGSWGRVKTEWRR